MKAMLTDTGNIVNDTVLCDMCYRIIQNRNIVRMCIVSTMDGIDKNSEFKNVPDNYAVTCCVCGKRN